MLMANEALAQDEWDFRADSHTALASVEFGEGVLVAVRCQAEQLNVIIGGVPSFDGLTRSVSVTRADGQTRRMMLSKIEGSNLLILRSARDARFLRASGQTTIESLPEDPHPFRMEVALPSQPSGVDKVLTACGYARDDDRDSLTDVSYLLDDVPRLLIAPFPRRYSSASVELSCLISESRLTACRSDRETPSGSGLGAATARLANGYRLSLSNRAEAEGGVLMIVVSGNH